MDLHVYALHDVKAGVFMRPGFAVSLGSVVRELTDLVNGDPREVVAAHPEDFRLYKLGVFNDSTGLFTLTPLPDLVLDCASLKSAPGVRPAGSGGNGVAIPVAAARESGTAEGSLKQ